MYCLTFVCLSVCRQLYLKTTERIFVNILLQMYSPVSVDNEERIKFYKSSASGYRNFLKTLQHCEMGHFSTIWLISLEKLIRSSLKLYCRCILGQEIPIKFWSNLAPESRSGLCI